MSIDDKMMGRLMDDTDVLIYGFSNFGSISFSSVEGLAGEATAGSSLAGSEVAESCRPDERLLVKAVSLESLWKRLGVRLESV